MTLLDDATMSDEYRERIMENRRYYASKQGTCQGNSIQVDIDEYLDRLRYILSVGQRIRHWQLTKDLGNGTRHSARYDSLPAIYLLLLLITPQFDHEPISIAQITRSGAKAS